MVSMRINNNFDDLIDYIIKNDINIDNFNVLYLLLSNVQNNYLFSLSNFYNKYVELFNMKYIR